MTILLALSFIVTMLLVLFTMILIWALTQDKESQNAIYIYLISNSLIISLYFLGNGLFQASTSLVVWQVVSGISLLNLLLCTVVRIKNVNIHWALTSLLSLMFSLMPFGSENLATDTLSKISMENESAFNISIIQFWIPLLVGAAISIIVYSILLTRRKKADVDMMRESIRREFEVASQDLASSRNMSFRSSAALGGKAVLNFQEDLDYKLDLALRRMDDMFEIHAQKFEQLALSMTKQVSGSTKNRSERRSDAHLLEINESISTIKNKIDLMAGAGSQRLGIYSTSENQNFIKELYHFLLTPLSQIETKTILLTKDASFNSEGRSPLGKHLLSIMTSVEICKSVLAAYRELAFVSKSVEWSPEFLGQSVASAADLYSENFEKEILFESTLAESIPPFSNNFILALLLPLIENAIRASPSGGRVAVNQHLNEETIRMVIKNEAVDPPTIDNLMTPDYSSKRNHKGTGLSIARHLVEDQYKGSIKFEVASKLVTTTISLPNRQKI